MIDIYSWIHDGGHQIQVERRAQLGPGVWGRLPAAVQGPGSQTEDY